MKKRILTLFSVVLTAIFTAGGLTACAPPHRYAENWSYNDSEHWRNVTCIHAPYVEVVREAHIFEDNFCTVCGYYKITDGLSYTAIRDLESKIIAYSVTGLGSVSGGYVGIPEKHDGKPVTGISYEVLKRAGEIVVPKTVTDIDTNGYVRGDFDLTKITVVPENSNYASQDGILYNKDKTEILYIPKVYGSVTIPEGVTEIPSYAFFQCTELFEINIPDSVTQIGEYAFELCNSLNFNLDQGLKYLGSNDNPYRILICPESDEVSYTVHKDTKIIAGGVFQSTSIADISLPEGLISICDNTFDGCEDLKEIILPDSLKIIGDSVFANCLKLQHINIPTNLQTLGENAFNSCTSLEFNEYGNAYYLGNKEYPELLLYRAIHYEITECTVSETTRFIYQRAFNQCNSLKEIQIPNSVTFIGEAAFSYCTLLESVILPDFLTELPANIFDSCYALKSVHLPEYLFTVGRYAFSNCSALTEISMPTHLKRIEGSAFYYCDSLKNIEVPASVEYIGSAAFAFCTSLNSITLPFVGHSRDAEPADKLFGVIFGSPLNTNLPQSLVYVKILGGTIGYLSFTDCKYIQIVDLENVTELWDGAFYNCGKLTKIDLGKSVKSIGKSAFMNCYLLTEITVPEGVEYIYEQTFCYCYVLNNVTLPSTLKAIERNSFSSCSQLRDLHYNGTVSQWFEVMRDLSSGINVNYTQIHCTDGETTYY